MLPGPLVGRWRDHGLVAEERLELILAEANKALAQQLDDLKSLRERAGALLAISGVATSVIGALAFHSPTPAPITGWTVVAALAFLGTFAFAMACLWPFETTFSNGAQDLLKWIDPGDLNADWFTRYLAEWDDKHEIKNQPKIRRRMLCYQWGVACLALEIFALLMNLRGH